MASKGKGKPLTATEIEKYEERRAMGWSVKESAEFIGRSPSPLYDYEKRKGQKPIELGSARDRKTDAIPHPSLSDAVAFIRALDSENLERASQYEEEFGRKLLASVAEVAIYLADWHADNYQGDILELAIDTEQEWVDEIRDNPLTASDVLAAIPGTMRRRAAGDNRRAVPERAEQWWQRIEETNPEVAAMHDEVKQAIASGDDLPEALVELKARIYKGDFRSDDPRAAVNG